MTRPQAKRGSGTFRRLPSGRVLYTISLGVDGGQRVRKSFSGRTEREARDAAAKYIEERRKQAPATSAEPLSLYLSRWVAQRARFLRPRTVRQYDSSIRTIALPALGGVTLGALSHRDVERMMAQAIGRGLSARSANLARTVLGIALRDAQRDGLVVQNAASLARSLPASRHRVEPLSPDDVRHLLDVTRESRWWPAYVLAVSLGLRQGELLALRWQDVDGAIRIEHTIRKHDGIFTLEPPKTIASRRVLPMVPMVAEALDVQRELQRNDRKSPGWVDYPPGGLVFTNAGGRPVTGVELTRRFQEALDRAGIRRVRFHDLRHTCATFLLAEGVDLKVISEILGHSSIAVTASVYTRVSDSLKADALGRLRLSATGTATEPAATE